MTPDDFPAHHPEWVQRDHMLIAWAMVHSDACAGETCIDASVWRGSNGDEWVVEFYSGKAGEWESLVSSRFDPFGLPILTPELRTRLGDEWRKWKDTR